MLYKQGSEKVSLLANFGDAEKRERSTLHDDSVGVGRKSGEKGGG